ncbi:hypothetical protein FBG13_06655 [Cobetia marina]|uniref:hypothetical protein n=1 Tax=Cobetia marina TaxID=28258 RepID=UPI0010AE22E2|nr:hypothetical protein [Cobetia marina]TKD62658.1 hypothetical protein FBG13_06655 [Cobetia marina]
MTVFETSCVLLYGYLLAWQWPLTNEVLGMLLMPGGVTWILRTEQHVSGPRQIAQGVPVAGPEK